MFEEWRQARQESQELNIIPVMNLFMVLIPFLLMGAAFFHVSVIPTSTASHTPGESDVPKTPKTVSASLVIKPDKLSLSFSSTSLSDEELAELAAQFPVEGDELPVDAVQRHLKTIKLKYPESTTLVVLPDGDLEYQRLVAVLDKTREFEAGTNDEGEKVYKELFPVTVFSKLIEGKPEDGEAVEEAR